MHNGKNVPDDYRPAEIVPAGETRPERAADQEILRDSEALAAFLDQPLIKIAELVTGLLAGGRSDFVLAGGRLVQAALKGKIFKQLGVELRALMEKGRINEDYAKTKYGFKSLVELLDFIDSEVPDEDRLNAVKAMFLALNSVDAKEGEELLNYQLLQIAKRLSSSQLLVLAACFELVQRADKLRPQADAREWFAAIAAHCGHKVLGLVEQADRALVDLLLLTPRAFSDGSAISRVNWRLTDLGMIFCERLRKYASELREAASAGAKANR